MTASQQTSPAQSPSVSIPTYWWYRARSELLESALGSWLEAGGLVLDVGSADGPSVDWISRRVGSIPLDIDPTGLSKGGVCGSALNLPFADDTFDAATAFDVLEHFPAEGPMLRELARVLRPSGRLLLAVPAYQWAWSSFDERVGHYRRYTRKRLLRALQHHGFAVQHTTYAFAATFPFFVADRLHRRLFRGAKVPSTLPTVPLSLEALLLRLCRIEARLLRRWSMPFGSSTMAVAVNTKP